MSFELELHVAILASAGQFLIQIVITVLLTLVLFSLYRLYRSWRGKA